MNRREYDWLELLLLLLKSAHHTFFYILVDYYIIDINININIIIIRIPNIPLNYRNNSYKIRFQVQKNKI
jgi:hypothetical protein